MNEVVGHGEMPVKIATEIDTNSAFIFLANRHPAASGSDTPQTVDTANVHQRTGLREP